MSETATLSDAELFAHCKRTAPLEDLRAYLRHAETLNCTFYLPDPTLAVFRDMQALERAIVAKPAPAHKAQVASLISRYKSSIPSWWKSRPQAFDRRGRWRYVQHRTALKQRTYRTYTLEESERILAAEVRTVPSITPAPVVKPKARKMALTACPHCGGALGKTA